MLPPHADSRADDRRDLARAAQFTGVVRNAAHRCVFPSAKMASMERACSSNAM
jgi:hypothetical protein